VLWLVKGLGPGGAERLLVEHARAADHRRVHYETAYLLNWKQHLVPDLEELGVTTHCLGVGSERVLRWVTRLRRLLLDGSYDIVHMHSPVPAVAARVLVRATPQRRTALISTEHNQWSSHHRATRIANWATIALDDRDVAVSSDVRASMPARLRSRVEVIVHGIDTDRVRAHLAERDTVRAELGVEPGQLLAVTVANLRANKNYPGLLSAARAAVDAGANVRFVAAGQGPLESEIRAEHARLALGDRFQLLGYRDDATRLIAAADLFVLASHHEGLPVTVMEAMVLGVPVVAPAVGGIPEAVTDDVDGLLVPPGDMTALAAAITRLAADHALLDRLAAGARAAGPRFDAMHAVGRLEQIYGELAAPR
jgi:glycosyltransferase involved in cell wall biosynthesis